MKTKFLAVVWLVLLCAGAEAAIVADFSGGAGSTSPTEYKGTAGDGWLAGWSSRNGPGGTTYFQVKADTPFREGDGNYLSIDYTRTSEGSSGRAGVARPFSTDPDNGGIDINAPYKISFEFRVEDFGAWNSSSEQLLFSSELSDTIGTFGNNVPWSLWIRGDDGFSVFNGNGSGGSTRLMFSNLGLGYVQANKIYSVDVYVDPLQKGYDLTITVDGTTYRASDLNGGNLLGFRDNSVASSANVLQFRSIVAVGNQVVWSIDNIAVAAIPEPGAGALLIGVGGWLVWRFRGSSLAK